MPTGDPERNEVQKEPAGAVPDRITRTIDYVRTAPENVKIALGVLAGMLLPAAVILLVIYGSLILRAILLLVAFVAAGTLLVVVMAVLREWRRVRRERMEVVFAGSQPQEAGDRQAQDHQEQGVPPAARALELQDISEGQMSPITDTDPLIVRESEVVWFRAPATLVGREEDEYGELYITSLRVVFLEDTDSVEIPLDQINAVTCSAGPLQVVGRTASVSRSFHVEDPDYAEACIRRAVKLMHRQGGTGLEGAGRQPPAI